MDLAVWNTIAIWIIASFFLIMTLVLLFVGIPVALDMKRSVRQVRATLDEVRVKLDPILFKAQAIASDIQDMTATAKREASRVGASFERVSERVDEFSALIETVQEEIQKPLMKSMATISGARRVISRFF